MERTSPMMKAAAQKHLPALFLQWAFALLLLLAGQTAMAQKPIQRSVAGPTDPAVVMPIKTGQAPQSQAATQAQRIKELPAPPVSREESLQPMTGTPARSVQARPAAEAPAIKELPVPPVSRGESLQSMSGTPAHAMQAGPATEAPVIKELPGPVISREETRQPASQVAAQARPREGQAPGNEGRRTSQTPRPQTVRP